MISIKLYEMGYVASLQLLAGFAVLSEILKRVVADHSYGSGPNGSTTADHPNLRATGLILVKVWCLIIAFVATFLAGISPYYLRWSDAFLVLGIQFAGGIFLATALIHFLADSNSYFQLHTTNTYPFGFMLATCGYLITMLADVVIVSIYSRSGFGESKNLKFTAKEDQESGERRVSNASSQVAANPVIVGAEHAAGVAHCSHCKNVSNYKSHSIEDVVPGTLIKKSSWSDALLLIMALCFHSVFEGIAIGVAETQHDAWRNLWTVCLHKIFAAIAMGISLLRIIPNRPLLSCAIYSFLFSISTPIGVAIGIIIDSTTQGAIADWIYAIAMGIACGVFIYVAINHLLAKGYVPITKIVVDKPFIKFMAVTLGAAVLAVAMIWD